ncbi:ethanolamine utilization protein EutD [Armatimonadota bacterium]|nr:ethanolamine utilization protein EutD [Armatimonadota bacterium]
MPLYAKVLSGVLIGIFMGVLKQYGWKWIPTESFGQIGLLVVRLLKTLATPLILFAILDSFLKTRITLRRGFRLIAICLLNVTVAMTIGLTIMNTFHPGHMWRGHVEELLGQVRIVGGQSVKVPSAPPDTKPSLDPVKNFAAYVPENVVDPFQKNSVISIVLMALLIGASLRHVKEEREKRGESGFQTIENVVSIGFQTLIQMLSWGIHLIPYAVCLVVADVVGKSGLGVFRMLSGFLAVILVGLAIHSLLYYPFIAWFMGGKSPKIFLGKGANAILTGLSMNSSLATVPITLRCLKDMGVSDQSARLASCVGTNLNNDGIMLYEAMTALFLAQARGFDLGFSQQMVVVFASIMAGAGIAGIPEAGLIVLPLVLSAAGLPEPMIIPALALIIPVDWIIARCRSGVNVMGDMVTAVQLDRFMSEQERIDLLAESGEAS